MKQMNIAYAVKDGLYLNLTNRCPCACTFCIRNEGDGVYGSSPLWLEHEPDFEEVKAALVAADYKKYKEIIFCGYGEPTEALDVLLETARFIKETSDAKVRLNTNGLANLIHQKDVTPLFKGLLDAVSISLNTSKADVYLNTCRPRFKEEAFPALLEFARLVKNHVPSVTMTTVSTTITHEDEDACQKICDELGVKYRIREFN
ncbi:MAG: TIGR04100 family radical SAM protein [Treponema sp.]|uniref:TIGR04100 family radical SAM protein n=1 Tax=Treponema sp. TaxID=166 RepID=UPI00298DD50F|nr:TIGR04100 family radical SAM protein [Treponema sp.]MCR5387533.1 TIGR04100 family radical SAM protein [Treponema sp.]